MVRPHTLNIVLIFFNDGLEDRFVIYATIWIGINSGYLSKLTLLVYIIAL
ncbi:hypothetical protein OKW21_001469 [Catalinimonas alkaloidigena]|nr:hypothetical protein [Catalinimonas alkaloidigena]